MPEPCREHLRRVGVDGDRHPVTDSGDDDATDHAPLGCRIFGERIAVTVPPPPHRAAGRDCKERDHEHEHGDRDPQEHLPQRDDRRRLRPGRIADGDPGCGHGRALPGRGMPPCESVAAGASWICSSTANARSVRLTNVVGIGADAQCPTGARVRAKRQQTNRNNAASYGTGAVHRRRANCMSRAACQHSRPEGKPCACALIAPGYASAHARDQREVAAERGSQG